MMRSSYIVCTLNRPDDLLRLVSSVVGQQEVPDELIVVDASSSEIAERNRRRIEQEVTGSGIGFEHAVSATANLPLQRNMGIELASGELLFFIDDDVILGPDFHHNMVDLHRRYQADGVAGIQPTLSG